MTKRKPLDKMKCLIICKKSYSRLLIRSTMINVGVKGDAISDIEKCQDIYYKLTDYDFDVIIIDHDEYVDFSYIKEINNNPYVKNTPIMIVTKQQTEDFIRKAIENGVSGIVLKPIPAQSLKKNLEKIPVKTNHKGHKTSKKQEELKKSA